MGALEVAARPRPRVARVRGLERRRRSTRSPAAPTCRTCRCRCCSRRRARSRMARVRCWLLAPIGRLAALPLAIGAVFVAAWLVARPALGDGTSCARCTTPRAPVRRQGLARQAPRRRGRAAVRVHREGAREAARRRRRASSWSRTRTTSATAPRTTSIRTTCYFDPYADTLPPTIARCAPGDYRRRLPAARRPVRRRAAAAALGRRQHRRRRAAARRARRRAVPDPLTWTSVALAARTCCCRGCSASRRCSPRATRERAARRRRASSRGSLGAGYLAGAFLLTLWMRALSLAGVRVRRRRDRAAAARARAPLLGYVGWRRHGGARPAACARAALRSACRPARRRRARRSGGALARVARAALRAARRSRSRGGRSIRGTRGSQWATKARVWFELGRIVPFVDADAMVRRGRQRRGSTRRRDYPATVPLLQVWACIALGRWDDALMNWPWWQIGGRAGAGGLRRPAPARRRRRSRRSSARISWPRCRSPTSTSRSPATPTCRWPRLHGRGARVPALGATRARCATPSLALLFAVACPLIKNPGAVWALTLLPGVVVALAAAPRARRSSPAGFGARRCSRSPCSRRRASSCSGYSPASRLRRRRGRRSVDSYFLLGNWHLLWYGAVGAALLAWRQLLAPPLAPLDGDRRRRPAVPVRRLRASPTPRVGRPTSRPSIARRCTSRRCWSSSMLLAFRAFAARWPRTPRPASPSAGDRRRDARRGQPRASHARASRRHALLHRHGEPRARAARARALARGHPLRAHAVPDRMALPAGHRACRTGIDVVADRADRDPGDEYSQFVLKSLLPHDRDAARAARAMGRLRRPIPRPGIRPSSTAITSAPQWHWHDDGMRVGNGGFSLRSRRLLEALQDPRIALADAEDETICRTFRPLLEREYGIRFADESLADRFSFEAAYPVGRPFGFHGLFNFCRVVPPARARGAGGSYSPTRSRARRRSGRCCATASRSANGPPRPRSRERMLAAAARRRRRRARCSHRRRPAPRAARRSAATIPARAAAASATSIAMARPARRVDGTRAGVRRAAPSADALVARAMDAHQRGDLDAAERGYRAALAVAPRHPHALHYLGVVLYQRDRLAEALPLLERAVALIPHEPEFHNNLGLALCGRGSHRRRDRRVPARARAEARSRGGVEQSRSRAAGGERSARGDRRVSPTRSRWCPTSRRRTGTSDSRCSRTRSSPKAGASTIGGSRSPNSAGIGPSPPGRAGTARIRPARRSLLTAEQGLGDTLQFVRFAHDPGDAGRAGARAGAAAARASARQRSRRRRRVRRPTTRCLPTMRTCRCSRSPARSASTGDEHS